MTTAEELPDEKGNIMPSGIRRLMNRTIKRYNVVFGYGGDYGKDGKQHVGFVR